MHSSQLSPSLFLLAARILNIKYAVQLYRWIERKHRCRHCSGNGMQMHLRRSLCW